MSPIGAVHTVFAFVAIGAGAVVCLLPKGTRWHRTLGHVYATSMAGVIVTALSIYRLTGGFGPFHVAAVIAGVTLAVGLAVVLLRLPRKYWMEAHAYWMGWSYIGLLAAFAAESLTRFVMPRITSFLEAQNLMVAFWTSVAIASFGVGAGGWWWLKTRIPESLARTPEVMRRERRRIAAEGDERATTGA